VLRASGCSAQADNCVCTAVLQQLEDYGKISFVRQYIGFGEENIGSAVSPLLLLISFHPLPDTMSVSACAKARAQQLCVSRPRRASRTRHNPATHSLSWLAQSGTQSNL
jgi:hypothetical protein